MRRTVRFHPMTALAGLVTALGGGLVAAVVLAVPGAAVATTSGVAGPAAVPAAAVTAAATGTMTGTTTGPAATAPPTVSPSTYGPCPTWTTTPWPDGVGPSWTFENGLSTYWSPRPDPGATLGVTEEAAASGTRSLRLDGVTPSAGVQAQVYGLPSVTWYTVKARVRAVAGSSPAYLTMSATVTSPDDRRPMTRRVTSDGWTDLVMSFRPDQQYPPGTCSGLGWIPKTTYLTITASTACPDAPTGPVSVYVDDVTVRQFSTTSTVVPPTSTDQIPTCGTPPSPPTTSAMQCTASYQVVSQWSGGHQANLTVRNMTATTLHPWTLKVTFPDDGQLYSLWGGGPWTLSGRTVTVVEPSWGQPIPPGGGVSVGFVRAGTASPPTAVSLNGMPCVLGAQG